MTTSVRQGTPTEKAAEPFMGTTLIPKERYTSKEYMELEWERMWTKVWNMAGRESDIANVGDYFTTELGSESLLIVREAEDKVRAFYNVCPHRGNQIRNPGMGHAESFQCAYHFFEFNLDGSKKFVPDEDTFTQGVPQETALVEVPCDTWGGFVWFNMNPRLRAPRGVPRSRQPAPRSLPLRGLRHRRRHDDRVGHELEDLRRRLQRGLPRAGHPSAAAGVAGRHPRADRPVRAPQPLPRPVRSRQPALPEPAGDHAAAAGVHDRRRHQPRDLPGWHGRCASPPCRRPPRSRPLPRAWTSPS